LAAQHHFLFLYLFMRVSLLLISFLLIVQFIKANDGAYYSYGGTIRPMKETTVQMRKEILNITRKPGNEWVQVSVYFELYNTGEAKDEIVGFVTPPCGGDLEGDLNEHPLIEKFTANANKQILSWKVTIFDSSGFLPYGHGDDYNFVYYFNMRFKKGLNIVKHTYNFHISGNVDLGDFIRYTWTTGKLCSGGCIGNFTLNLDLGDDQFFGLPSTFHKDKRMANWKINGTGRITDTSTTWDNGSYEDHDNFYRLIYIKKGSITLNEKNFAPDYNFIVTYFNNPGVRLLTEPKDKEVITNDNFGDVWTLMTEREAEMSNCSDWTLTVIKNYYYALKGYAFKNKDLANYFSHMRWYYPDSKLEQKDIKLTVDEYHVIALIDKELAKRQKK
jgi:hypothetical protein